MSTRPPTDHRRARRPSGLAAALLAVVAMLGGTLLLVAPAGAQSDAGVATIRSRSGEPIQGGASATEFTVSLPDGAMCPGDSANDDYRVGSYMLPEDVDPFDVEWSGEGPYPYALSDYETFRQPLYDDLTSGFSSKLLAENDGPGEPGQILEFPAFTFDVYAPGMVPAGRYNVGIVCNHLSEVTTAWNAVIEVQTDAADAPAQFTWTIVEGAAPAGSGSSPVLLVGIVALVVVVACAGWLLVRRRAPRTRTPQPTRELR